MGAQCRAGLKVEAGREFTIQASSDLETWESLETISSVEPSYTFIESDFPGSGKRFYRARYSD